MDGAASAPKRHIRLVFALVVASLLGTFAVYTALVGDTTPLLGVAQAASGQHAGQSVQLTGKVVRYTGDAGTTSGMRIILVDDAASQTIPVVYHGAVPDAFEDGRHVVFTGRLRDGVFVAASDSLVTKCPSKYQPVQPSHQNA